MVASSEVSVRPYALSVRHARELARKNARDRDKLQISSLEDEVAYLRTQLSAWQSWWACLCMQTHAAMQIQRVARGWQVRKAFAIGVATSCEDSSLVAVICIQRSVRGWLVRRSLAGATQFTISGSSSLDFSAKSDASQLHSPFGGTLMQQQNKGEVSDATVEKTVRELDDMIDDALAAHFKHIRGNMHMGCRDMAMDALQQGYSKDAIQTQLVEYLKPFVLRLSEQLSVKMSERFPMWRKSESVEIKALAALAETVCFWIADLPSSTTATQSTSSGSNQMQPVTKRGMAQPRNRGKK